MYKILKFLFPGTPADAKSSWLLLTARVVFGLLFLSHGVAKLQSFETLAATFPDPLSLGSGVSLTLAIFGELLCSVAFILGLFYRLALIPMIFTMCIAFFVIHSGDTFAVRELALCYLSVFVLMFFAGPGRFALDTPIARWVASRK